MHVWLPLGLAAAAALAYALVIASYLPGLWRTSKTFNSTADWVPARPGGPEKPPPMTDLTSYFGQIATRSLEDGEPLIGYGLCFFSPPRPKDWKFGKGIAKLPLLVAATPHRILFFELEALKAQRTLFVRHEDIAALDPPQPGLWGGSRPMKLALKSGVEYSFGFHGPLFNEEGMRQEQNMASHFRHLAERFPASLPEDAAAA